MVVISAKLPAGGNMMTLQEIYELAIATGIKADPRGPEGVKKALEKAKKTYESLPEKKKPYFDQEGLNLCFLE